MKKLHYIIISALLVGGCQSDPRLESEASPLVRTKVSELYYAQSDNIDLEALNIVSPSKFVRKLICHPDPEQCLSFCHIRQ